MAVKTKIPVFQTGAERLLEREAQLSNIHAGMWLAATVESSIGPKGMRKILYDPTTGQVRATKDGATILTNISITHPVAQLVADAAMAQDENVGDGTKSVAILAGKLLEYAEELLKLGLEANRIIDGYKLAMDKAVEITDEISETLDYEDKETLKRIARGAMSTKLSKVALDKYENIVLQAIDYLREKKDDHYDINFDNLKVVGKLGGSIEDTEVVDGVIVDGEVARSDMPRKIRHAKIALIANPIRVEIPAEKVRVETVEKFDEFVAAERKVVEDSINRIVDLGANVVFCEGEIDVAAQHYFAKNGVLAIQNVDRGDILKLANATGAIPVLDIDDITVDDLGEAGVVEEKKVATVAPGVVTGEEAERERWGSMIFVQDVPNKQACTILVRGATQPIIDEAIVAISDAMFAIRNVLTDNKYVPGGGGFEIELARRLWEYAEEIEGEERNAIEKFADAMKAIPTALAKNAGMDVMRTIAELIERHEKGELRAGIDVETAEIKDMTEVVIEPMMVKRNAIVAAAENAMMILRSNDMFILTMTEAEHEKTL